MTLKKKIISTINLQIKSTHENKKKKKKKKSNYKMRYLGGNIYAKISWARLRTIAVNESSCINNLGSNQEGKKKVGLCSSI